MLANNMNL